MTKEEFIDTFPNYEIGIYNENLVLIKRLSCKHYRVFYIKTNTYIEHDTYFNISLFKQLDKNTEYMIFTKENLIKAYKNNPENRKLLIDLFGQFMPEEDIKIIELEEKNKELEIKLANCTKSS